MLNRSYKALPLLIAALVLQPPTRTLSSLSTAFWLEQHFHQKPSKHIRNPCFLHHLNIICECFWASFINWNLPFRSASSSIQQWQLVVWTPSCFAELEKLHHPSLQSLKANCLSLNQPIQPCFTLSSKTSKQFDLNHLPCHDVFMKDLFELVLMS